MDLVTGRFNKGLEKLVGISEVGGSEAMKRMGKIALGTIGGGLAEGGQEGVQTLLERLGAHQDVSSDEAWSDYRNSIALGALGGVAGGGVGGALSSSRNQGDARSRFAAFAQSVVGDPVARNIKDTLQDASTLAPETAPIEFEEGLPNPTPDQLAKLDTNAERAKPDDWSKAVPVAQVDPDVAGRVGEVRIRPDHSAYLVQRPGEAEARVMPAVSNLIGADEILTPGGKSKGGTNNPHFPALRSGHRLLQRPSPQKQIPSSRLILSKY
ncbi:MAG: hypothetical protein NTV46_03200 [Verrucomicrobia bacterium]|nr:hypothetical protein [Verrucomicrobiota bacterium]